ncbi:MAG: CHAT domain-containing protein [Erythrobacter sp.]|jgi:CHAT domain-containing protein|nr:CHAT domain-containing protein [Erythrobacter sp.]
MIARNLAKFCAALSAPAVGAALLLASPVLLATPASAQVYDEACRSPRAAPIEAAGDDAAIRAATQAAENLLAEDDTRLTRGSAALETLRVDRAALEAAPLRTLAAYCAAAGEAMRSSERGSEFQARTFLKSAFLLAEAAGAADLAATAALRLGLVVVKGTTVPAVRGLRREGTRSAAAEQTRAQGFGQGVCGELARVDLAQDASEYVSVLSFECAAERGLEAGRYATAALAQLRLARAALGTIAQTDADLPELRSAMAATIEDGLATAGLIDDAALGAEMTGRLIEIALDEGTLPPARFAAPVAALARAAAGDPGLLAFAEALHARIALARGDRAAAAAAANRAIFLESQRALPARLADWYLILAEAEPGQRTAHALAAYRALEAVRLLLPPSDPLTEESTFALRMRRVFERAVDVTLEGAGALDQVAIARAQAIIETYREAEIQSVFGSECVPPRLAINPGQLAANEILLYPVLLEDRIELIVTEEASDGSGARYRRLEPNRSANRQQVAGLVEQVILALSYGDDGTWQDAARQLHALLIAPIGASLGEDTTLVIIPDGPLRPLPFAALIGPDGGYLVEQTRLGVSPALGFSQPGESAARGESLRVLSVSLERAVELPAGTFPALSGTSAEARIAAGIGRGRGSLMIENFGRDDLVGALQGQAIDVLHLATHASFNGGSDRSFIVADGAAIYLSELRELIDTNAVRGGTLDLIVLSACETAIGDDEASMGLAGAAVQAGARSALASLWQVSDLGTAELMRQFYARYATGASKADAMRGAQLALLGGGDEFADPNIWAAFTLLGSWR